MNPILFLDFDGVAHGQPCRDGLEFSNLHIIEAVLREYQNVDVVISSTWREQYTLAQLQDFFSHDLQKRVIDVTPFFRSPKLDWTTVDAPTRERQWEIVKWLEKNRPGAFWIAIDDCPALFNDRCANLLVTNSKFGFHPDQVDELRSLIERGGS